jgi:hypothetical protein
VTKDVYDMATVAVWSPQTFSDGLLGLAVGPTALQAPDIDEQTSWRWETSSNFQAFPIPPYAPSFKYATAARMAAEDFVEKFSDLKHP